jgi:lipoprotein NlpD
VSLSRAIAVGGICCAMMMACASGRPSRATTYIVQPGDTLYSIAWRQDLDFRELARWNDLRPDTRLAVGQILMLEPGHNLAAVSPASPSSTAPATVPATQPKVPVDSRTANAPRVGKPVAIGEAPAPPVAAAAPAAAPAVVARTPVVTGTVRPSAPRPTPAVVAPTAIAPPTATAPTVAVAAAANGRAKWVWPTDHPSTPHPVPGGGILLLGRLGQDIRAAAAGRVVYTGSGLRGYGNLIILKHGDGLLSSYAHNRELLVHEGQDVATGQVIAHMGTGPHQISALYFEIRVNGKPTDPLHYLAP